MSMSSPDQAPNNPDLRLVSGCRDGGGVAVGKIPYPADVWTCPGKFGPTEAVKKASDLCGTGYSICQDVTEIDLNACKQVQGIYMFAFPVYYVPGLTPYQIGCGGVWGADDTKTWPGCGMTTAPYVVSPPRNPNCVPWTQFIYCGNGNTWDCRDAAQSPNSTLDEKIAVTKNSNPQDGALCCKN